MIRFRFPGDPGYSGLSGEELAASWMPHEDGRDSSRGRFDLLVVGQLERFWDSDAGHGAPTYGSAFGRRVGGSMVSDAVAEQRVALRAGVMLVDRIAHEPPAWAPAGRPELGPLRRWMLRRLLMRLDPQCFGRHRHPLRLAWSIWKLNNRWSPWRVTRRRP